MVNHTDLGLKDSFNKRPVNTSQEMTEAKTAVTYFKVRAHNTQQQAASIVILEIQLSERHANVGNLQ